MSMRPSRAVAASFRNHRSGGPLSVAPAWAVGWMLIGYGGRLGLQAAALLLLARALGPAGFGTFIAAFAVGTLLAPLVEFGAYGLIVRDHVAGHSLRRSAGQSLIVAGVLLPVWLGVLGLGQAFLQAPIPPGSLLVIAGGTALSASVSNVSRAAHVATNLFARYALLEIVSGAFLLAWVFVLLWLQGDIGTWTKLFAIHCLLVCAIAIGAFVERWGTPAWETRGLGLRVRPGSQLTAAATAQIGLTEIDKMVLVHAASLDAAGIYGAAQRIAHVAYVPLIAMFGTTYRRFFERGRDGLGAAGALARKLVPRVLAYGVVVTVLLWLSAPLIAALLGPGFEQTAPALRLLAPLVIVLGLQMPFGDALTGSDLQGLRTALQSSGLGMSALFNLWLVPTYGLYGSILAAWITHASVLLFLVVAVLGRDSLPGLPRRRTA